jgi:RecA-family ATPase
LITRTASERLNSAKSKPPVTPLFDAFWLKGELAFLFGSANVGKSILAVQIADAIAKGVKIQNFDGPQTPMKVGYFDFELSHCPHPETRLKQTINQKRHGRLNALNELL